MESELESRHRSAVAEHSVACAALREEHVAELAASEASHARALAESERAMRAEHSGALAAVREESAAAVRAAEEAQQESLVGAEGAVSQLHQVRQAYDKLAEERSALEEAHREALAKVVSSHDATVAELSSELQSREQLLHNARSHAEQLGAQSQQAHQLVLSDLSRERDVAEKYRLRLECMEEKTDKEKSELRQQLGDRVSMVHELQGQVAVLEIEKRRLQALQVAHGDRRNEGNAGVPTRTGYAPDEDDGRGNEKVLEQQAGSLERANSLLTDKLAALVTEKTQVEERLGESERRAQAYQDTILEVTELADDGAKELAAAQHQTEQLEMQLKVAMASATASEGERAVAAERIAELLAHAEGTQTVVACVDRSTSTEEAPRGAAERSTLREVAQLRAKLMDASLERMQLESKLAGATDRADRAQSAASKLESERQDAERERGEAERKWQQCVQATADWQSEAARLAAQMQRSDACLIAADETAKLQVCEMRQLEEKAVSMRVRPCCLPTPRSRRSAQARARAQVSELHDRIATLKANVGMLAALSVSAGAALATHVAL